MTTVYELSLVVAPAIVATAPANSSRSLRMRPAVVRFFPEGGASNFLRRTMADDAWGAVLGSLR